VDVREVWRFERTVRQPMSMFDEMDHHLGGVMRLFRYGRGDGDIFGYQFTDAPPKIAKNTMALVNVYRSSVYDPPTDSFGGKVLCSLTLPTSRWRDGKHESLDADMVYRTRVRDVTSLSIAVYYYSARPWRERFRFYAKRRHRVFPEVVISKEIDKSKVMRHSDHALRARTRAIFAA
jgi:hypothetical protein